MAEPGFVMAVVALAAFAGTAVLWRKNIRIARARPGVHDAAPGFTLRDQHGASHTLDEFRGQWLVLYFYPRDDTPGCTEQAGRYRDAMRELESLGARVCGISVDDSDSHADFSRKYKLPFLLLADHKGHVAARYGSLRDIGPLKFAMRNTFLIDPAGKIARVYVGVSAARNTHDVLQDLKALATP